MKKNEPTYESFKNTVCTLLKQAFFDSKSFKMTVTQSPFEEKTIEQHAIITTASGETLEIKLTLP